MGRNYNEDILEKMLTTGSGDPYEDIEETCLTYADYGALMRDCLSYFGGSGNWDNDAFDFLHRMVSEIYEDLGDGYFHGEEYRLTE